MFNKAKELANEQYEKEHLESVKELILSHEEFQETTMKLNVKERNKFCFCHLDNSNDSNGRDRRNKRK